MSKTLKASDDKVRGYCIALAASCGIDNAIEEEIFNLSQDHDDPVFWYLRKMLFVVNSKSALTSKSIVCSLCDPNNWSEQLAENLPKNKTLLRKVAREHLPEHLFKDSAMSVIKTRYVSLGFDDTCIADLILGLVCYSVFIALEIGAPTSFGNEAFRKIIRSKHLMVLSSLENNSAGDNLFDMLSCDELNGFDLSFMTRRQLLPKLHEKRYREQLERQGIEDINIIDPDNLEDGFYECEKCNNKKTTHESRQIRSADEPATIFITCHICRYVWKEN